MPTAFSEQCQFSSFGSPGGRNSPFPIGLENGHTTVLRTNVLHCDMERCYTAMFGDLDWPPNASRGFVSISWASCSDSYV